MPHLKLFLFGPPRLERAGEAINISLRKALALLAYLAVTQQSHSRDALATLFWPDDDQSKARANLRRALSRINTALGEGQLAIDRENAGLNPKVNLWLDVDQFQHRLTQCQTHGHAATEVCFDCLPLLTEAAELYADDFLAGFTLPDCPDFDEWQFFQSEGLRQALASTLELLVRGHSEQHNYDVAIPYARRWLALDPLHEPAQRQLMELYAHTGQQTAALRQYQECVRMLDEELGILPSEETTALYEAIKAKQFPRPKAEKRESQEAGGQRGRGAEERLPPHNLPPQPTPFIGREDELAEITQHLADPGCRLLTLVGPGGIGKTRLALEAGARLLPDGAFPGGIYFVPLAALSSSDFLVSAIADVLDVSFQGDEALQKQLLNVLAEIKQAMLLVLDNFEQLVEGAELLAAILQNAPAVKLLVTSRERLNLRDEWLLDIRGLPFPKMDVNQISKVFKTFEISATHYSAVQLFEQRAKQVQVNFDLTADYPAVIRICQLVEGMPLGLELAATWVRVLSCQEIAQEIEKNLNFLTTSLRDVPARHRSLAAVFDHSWNYLSPEEQHVFRSLAVFRGGFTRDAAEQVAGASLSLLAALVDKSMLHRNDSGRYELHELLRQYAADKLDEAGEAKQVRDRHLSFFLELAEEAEPKLQGAKQATWLKKLNTENGNLRAALEWSLEDSQVETGLRLTATLGQFWHMRSHLFDEGAEWMERVLSKTDPSEQTQERAKTFYWLGIFAHYQSDDTTAAAAFEKSLVLYQALGDKTGIADSCLYLGDIAAFQGNDGVAYSRYTQARLAYEESLTSLREQNDKWTLARSLNYLGELTRTEDDYTAARLFYEESLAIRRELDDQRGMAVSLYNLGHVTHFQGNIQQAAMYFAESLPLSQKLGDKRGMADNLAGLAGVAGTVRQPERAARLFGAAEVLYEDSITRLEYPDQVEYDRNVATVRAQLDEATFAAAWAEGRQWTLEQAVQEALAVGKLVEASNHLSAENAVLREGRSSERERPNT